MGTHPRWFELVASITPMKQDKCFPFDTLSYFCAETVSIIAVMGLLQISKYTS